MVLAVELGLIFYGIYVLRNARFDCGKDRIVIGLNARVLGILCLLPLPVSSAICFIIGVVNGLQNKPVPAQSFYAMIELIILVGILVAIYLLSSRYYKKQQSSQCGQLKVEIGSNKEKPFSPTLSIVAATTGAIIATQLAQGGFQKFNIWVALLFVGLISLVIWLFGYSPLGKWLNRWMMSSFDDFQKAVENKPKEKKEATKK